jgi:hypothetical protein
MPILPSYANHKDFQLGDTKVQLTLTQMTGFGQRGDRGYRGSVPNLDQWKSNGASLYRDFPPN